jgi:hypothetical protein
MFSPETKLHANTKQQVKLQFLLRNIKGLLQPDSEHEPRFLQLRDTHYEVDGVGSVLGNDKAVSHSHHIQTGP